MNEEICVPFKTMDTTPELSLIGKSIANMDEMVRKVHTVTQENQKIREKYKSLNQAAKTVKELYEKERNCALKLKTENIEFLATINNLRDRNLQLEHEHVNMKLSHSQMIAEMEAKKRKDDEKCTNVLKELISNFQELEMDTKMRAILKQVADILIKKGVEVDRSSLYSRSRRQKRKRKKSEVQSVTEELMSMTDSETNQSYLDDSESDVCSDQVSIKFVPLTPPENDLIPAAVETTTKECSCVKTAKPAIEKSFVTLGTNTECKTFTEKATSAAPSMVTRGTSTSLETCDVGTNFPEYHTLPSIQEILQEMIIDIPPLLKMIEEPPITSTSTQTTTCTQEDKSTSTTAVTASKTKNSGTITDIKNIRKPIDYSANLLHRVKKEESFVSFEPESELNPQLTYLWALLGQMIFQVIGNGQVFDTSQMNNNRQAWEQIRKIQQIIEMEGTGGVMNFEPQMFVPPNPVGIVKLSNASGKGMQCFESLHPEQLRLTENFENPCTLEEPSAVNRDDTEEIQSSPIDSAENTVVQQQSQSNAVSPQDECMPGVSEEISSKSPSKKNESTVHQNENSVENGSEASELCKKIRLALIPDANVVATASSKEPELKSTPTSNDTLLANEITPPRPAKTCQQILNSFKRIALLSPIKDTPKRQKNLITLMDLTDEEMLPDFSEASEHETLIASILNEDEDSPKSPPASPFNQENELADTREIPLESCPFDYDSPRSPIRVENCDEMIPKLIPLNRDIEVQSADNSKCSVPNTSIVNAIVNEYDSQKRVKLLSDSHGVKESPKSSKGIESLRKHVNNYLESDWTSASLKLVCQKCMKYLMQQKIIIAALIETVEDHADDSVNMENTPPAPPLPKTHQKLVLLAHKLNLQMPGFIRELVKTLERKIFTLKAADDGYSLDVLLSLFHFYLGLIDVEPTNANKSTARLLIFKALYYFNHKSFPLIYLILAVYPNCLPKTTDLAYKDDDPLVTTIKCILMNSSREKLEKTEYKKRDLRAMLIKQFGYLPLKPTLEEVIQQLIQRLQANQLTNLDYCFILLSKRYGYEWAVSTLIKPHLYPMLDQLMAASMHTEIHNEKIIVCITTISSILKTYSLSADVTYVMQLFTTVLERSNSQIIQEAAVEGLLRFQRFGFIDVYQRISRWNPQNPVSDKLKAMLKTFIHRKDLRFWINLSRQTR